MPKGAASVAWMASRAAEVNHTKEGTMELTNLIEPKSCPLCGVPCRRDGRRNRRTRWKCPDCGLAFETTELLDASDPFFSRDAGLN